MNKLLFKKLYYNLKIARRKEEKEGGRQAGRKGQAGRWAGRQAAQKNCVELAGVEICGYLHAVSATFTTLSYSAYVFIGAEWVISGNSLTRVFCPFPRVKC